MPASVHTPFNSAPEQPFIFSAILVRLIPRVRFIDREWIRRISARASTLASGKRQQIRLFNQDRGEKSVSRTYVGGGNSIFLSIRPGRSKAGSRMSSLFVAIITLIFFVGSNPSS
jgi:hypothetical protein